MLPNAAQKLGDCHILRDNQQQMDKIARGNKGLVGTWAKVYLCLFVGLGAAVQ
jgi:hypothetical protein